jgi:hypothetical protein
MVMVRCSQNVRRIPLGEKHGGTNFLFRFSLMALIDAIVLTGIPSRQIR